jgi:hypothetical protein
MHLQYLGFASSDDGADRGSWEAMASVRPEQLPLVQPELQAVLDWAERHSPGPRGPEEEGGIWDAHVQQLHEAGGWVTLTLTLIGPRSWGEALMQACEAAG